jgi:hypothetical protein
MDSEYLCPEEHSFYCSGKGCVLDKDACDPLTNAVSKPGYKSISVLNKDACDPVSKPGYKSITKNPGMPMIQADTIEAQELLHTLSNIKTWSKDGQPNSSDVIRFCANLDNQQLWIKMLTYSSDKDSAYACFKNENAFFSKNLSTYTPHIVQSTTFELKTKTEILFDQSKQESSAIFNINDVIIKIKKLTPRNEQLIGVFYMQPDKWVYLESFMDASKFIVTQEMVISILFQIVYTIACLQSKKYIHGNLNKNNTIALDLRPIEKTITYYRNSVTFIVPINVKVIILNWEDVTKGDGNSDIVNVCECFERLLSKLNHPDINNLNSFFNDGRINGSADNLLENDIFKRFKQYSLKK